MTTQEMMARIERIKALKEKNLKRRKAIVTFNKERNMYQVELQDAMGITSKLYKNLGSVKRFLERHTLEEGQVIYNI